MTHFEFQHFCDRTKKPLEQLTGHCTTLFFTLNLSEIVKFLTFSKILKSKGSCFTAGKGERGWSHNGTNTGEGDVVGCGCV